MSADDIFLNGIFDAAMANNVFMHELLIELVLAGSLSREAVASILIRSERFMAHLPPDSVARHAHEAIFEQVQSRLALKPDVDARRLDPRR